MNFDRAVYETLRGLVADHVYLDEFPQTIPTFVSWPAMRWTITNTQPPEDLCGTGDGAQDDVSIQVEIVAETRDQRRSVRDALVTALENGLVVQPGEAPCPARRQGEATTYDGDAKVYRIALNYLLSPSS